jgi:hypothetical protein
MSSIFIHAFYVRMRQIASKKLQTYAAREQRGEEYGVLRDI